MAGHVGLELRNVVANYPFERSGKFLGIRQNVRHRDYSRLGCAVGEDAARALMRGLTSAALPPFGEPREFKSHRPWPVARRLEAQIRGEPDRRRTTRTRVRQTLRVRGLRYARALGVEEDGAT
jgi:hypothetical protein